MIQNKRILIPGGAGSIGSELVRQLVKHNTVFVLDNNETATFDLIEELKLKKYSIDGRVGDVRDSETVEDVFVDFKPEYVFVCSAYKHVTPMEWYPMEAVNVNILGTANLLKFSKRYSVEKFIFISTDKAVSANSVMGATKRVGEIMTKNSGKGYVVVRFGNVLGSRGSVIPLWQQQIDNNESVTVTDKKMERYFMTIPEACKLVTEATEIGKGGEIILFEMGKRINVYNLAKQIISESKKDVKIKLIGVRPGETMTEELMSEEEKKKVIKKGKFYILT